MHVSSSRDVPCAAWCLQGDGLTAATLYGHLKEFVAGRSEQEQRALFHDTAKRFYSIE